MIALGIDPDSKDCAVAGWNDDGPFAAQVIHVVRRKTKVQSQVLMAAALADTNPRPELFGLQVMTIAIEGQQKDGRRARPQDLFTLAHVTGSALSWCTEWWGMANIVIPTPKKWKGSVAKHAMQARMYRELGWGYTIIGTGTSKYARPEAPPARFNHITKGQWKHVGDALLLAQWAYDTTT
jgi:hypothetical protein